MGFAGLYLIFLLLIQNTLQGDIFDKYTCNFRRNVADSSLGIKELFFFFSTKFSLKSLKIISIIRRWGGWGGEPPNSPTIETWLIGLSHIGPLTCHQENISVKYIPPYTPLLYRNGVCRGIPNFQIVDSKHTLWVLIRNISFEGVLTCIHNVRFELKYLNNQNFSNEIFCFFIRKKDIYILYRQVFVMFFLWRNDKSYHQIPTLTMLLIQL